MNSRLLFCTFSSIAALSTAYAAPVLAKEVEMEPQTAWQASRIVDSDDMVTTGVARGRDRLNSATSTSAIKDNDIVRLAPRTMAELFRNIPGIRVEAGSGEGGNSYTVRGLPLAGEGAKYIQIQEDGLPVIEFGDISQFQPDQFTRIDLNVAQVQSIRGGSSSTFASNAPGGVINLISKTGEVQGGSIQATTGLNYDTNRLDFDYGGRINDDWRFHVGGFYRTGEGPRRTGYNAYDGGQLKFNATRDFKGGYVRFYGKILDDQSPNYRQYPGVISGTNDDPDFGNLPGFSLTRDSLYSPNIETVTTSQFDGTLGTSRYRDGVHAKTTSGGFEAQFQLAGWTVMERFRYSALSMDSSSIFPAITGSPARISSIFSIPSATFSYASGPQTGQAYDSAQGTGLLAVSPIARANGSADNVTNDIRSSRVFKVGGGDLTTTFGLYNSSQQLDRDVTISTIVHTVEGDGRSALINIAAMGGLVPLSQNGTFIYSSLGGTASINSSDVTYDIAAPYASLNFQSGRFAVGGSIRYDYGNVEGSIQRALPATGCVDVNGDGVTAPGTAECRTTLYAPGGSTPVDYDYRYLSYSTGLNFRMSDSVAMFARYSKGSRAGAEAILFSPEISSTDGSLANGTEGYDPVKQAETGIKYRRDGITLNLTGFYATTDEVNNQIGTNSSGQTGFQLVSRSYSAYGAEFEGGIRRGPFSLAAGATLAKAKIDDAESPAFIGNTPRHQPSVVYQLTPQYDTNRFTVGANIVGVTESYAQDTNQLKLPGYATVGLFVQVRPVERLELSVNATNIFDTMAVTDTLDATFPSNNVVLARTLYGRLISASARYFF